MLKNSFQFLSEHKTFSRTEVPDEQSNIFQKYSKTLVLSMLQNNAKYLQLLKLYYFIIELWGNNVF